MSDQQTASPPTTRPRLERDPDGALWLGVASGLANHFGVDPLVPRVVFGVLVFAGGLGLWLYLACWLLIALPGEQGAPTEIATRRLRETPTWLAAVGIAVGLLWVSGMLGLSGPGLVWGLALVGLGVLLFQQDTRAQTATPAVPPPPTAAGPSPAPPAPGSPGPRGGATPSPTAVSAPLGSAPPPPSRPDASAAEQAPPPRPSVLGRLTVALGLVAVGVTALLANTSAVAGGARTYLGVLLVVVGAGLVVGAWWGRARWLAVVGLVLVPMALATGVRGLPAPAGAVGDFHWRPLTAADLDDDYRLLAGEATLDLTALAAGEPVDIDASVTLGQLRVLVPEGSTVEVTGSVLAGEITFFETTEQGVLVNSSGRQGTGIADYVIDLRAGLGELEVTTAPGGLR